jgi:hypothetical protein
MCWLKEAFIRSMMPVHDVLISSRSVVDMIEWNARKPSRNCGGIVLDEDASALRPQYTENT